MVPRENKNNAYAKSGGKNKEYYGIFRSGLLKNQLTYLISTLFTSIDLNERKGYERIPYRGYPPIPYRGYPPTARPEHNTGNSLHYSFRTVREFFYVPQNSEQ